MLSPCRTSGFISPASTASIHSRYLLSGHDRDQDPPVVEVVGEGLVEERLLLSRVRIARAMRDKLKSSRHRGWLVV
jgi:hypothetical protein